MSFFVLFLLITSFWLLSAPAALAQCPVCVVTVGGGMLIARKLGVDDLLVSLWIGALNIALSFWLAPKMKNEKWSMVNFLSNPWIFSAIMIVSTLAYFRFTDQIGHPSNQLWGIDKIILGQIVGSLVMVAGNSFYQFIKKKFGVPFPYAKVVFPFIFVLVVTLVFKFVLRSGS